MGQAAGNSCTPPHAASLPHHPPPYFIEREYANSLVRLNSRPQLPLFSTSWPNANIAHCELAEFATSSTAQKNLAASPHPSMSPTSHPPMASSLGTNNELTVHVTLVSCRFITAHGDPAGHRRLPIFNRCVSFHELPLEFPSTVTFSKQRPSRHPTK